MLVPPLALTGRHDRLRHGHDAASHLHDPGHGAAHRQGRGAQQAHDGAARHAHDAAQQSAAAHSHRQSRRRREHGHAAGAHGARDNVGDAAAEALAEIFGAARRQNLLEFRRRFLALLFELGGGLISDGLAFGHGDCWGGCLLIIS